MVHGTTDLVADNLISDDSDSAPRCRYTYVYVLDPSPYIKALDLYVWSGICLHRVYAISLLCRD